jgi:hypothetical protein
MGARGRKSAADLSVVRMEPRIGRPRPPADLTNEQAEEWRAIVARLPPGWFRREHYGVLANLCRHTSRARFLGRALELCAPENLTTVEGLDHYNKMAAAAERETRSLLACARSLRLTHQSQYDAAKAARGAATASTESAPWEFEGVDEEGAARESL